MRFIRLNQLTRDEAATPIWLNPDQITSIEPRETGSMIYGVRYAIRVKEAPEEILANIWWEEKQQ